jgi:hypothetical protein
MAINVVLLSIIGKGPMGEEIVNTFHYASPDPPGTPFNALGFLGNCSTLATALTQAVTSDYHLVNLNAKCVFGPDLGAVGDDASGSGTAGTLTPPSAPLQCCVILKKLTGDYHRYGRGRIFISPFKASQVDVNGVVVAAPSGVGPLGAEMLNQISDTVVQYTPILWHKTVPAILPLVGYAISSVCGVRRSRRGPGL